MIKERYEWVKQQLIQDSTLRDSNEKLYYKYLLSLNYNIDKSIKEFLKDMECRNISYMDAISRTSRRVQEDNFELRGRFWNKRKNKLEPEIVKEIKDLMNGK